MANVVIIIVNFNGEHHLPVCLSSLYSQTYTGFITFFVDNASSDNSINYVKNNYPQIKLIQNKKNLGFAEANNIGIREAMMNTKIKYVVTLNNDIEADLRWLEKLIQTMNMCKDIGAVTSKMLLYDKRNFVDSAGDIFDGEHLKIRPRGHGQQDKAEYNKTQEIFSACAGAAMYRREMLEDVRLLGDYFDKSYFAYLEDVDLSLRARLRGWKIFYCHDAIVYHKGSATSKKMANDFTLYHSSKNKLYTIIKNYPLRFWTRALRADPGVDRLDPRSINIYKRIIPKIFFHLPKLLLQRSIIRRRRKIEEFHWSRWLTGL